MEKIKVLNLYCGLGGNRKNWQNVAVTAIDTEEKIARTYKSLFPRDNVIIADAKYYLSEKHSEYDFIWASPPCQSNSKMALLKANNCPSIPDLSVYELVIFLKRFFNGFFCVENVIPFYDPLITPTVQIGRHLFWCNYPVKPFKAPHFSGFMNKSTVNDSRELMQWLDIFYDGTLYYKGNHDPCQVLRNCVHPLIGDHIFFEYLKEKKNIKN